MILHKNYINIITLSFMWRQDYLPIAAGGCESPGQPQGVAFLSRSGRAAREIIEKNAHIFRPGGETQKWLLLCIEDALLQQFSQILKKTKNSNEIPCIL
ncbi:MAG: hypothetical protein AB9872_04025 [Solidesulfovibrio sp.]